MTASSPADIELLPESIMQPDVFVIPNDCVPSDRRMKWKDVDRLVFAAEVLSPSSLHQDRVLKRDFYLNRGVPDYWILDMDARVFECWSPHRERPTIVRDQLVWHPAGARAPLTLDVREFFEQRCRLPRWI